MSEGTGQQGRQIGLHLWQHGAVFLMACAVIVARRPDAIFHAQFWAEDGHVWFADAYNFGWPALIGTYNGYFHAVPRLGASLALLVPLSLAPLVLNLIAIAIQALPVNLLLIARSSMWGSLGFRASMAVLYLVLPNSAEIRYGITESQWALALCAFLVVVSDAPKRRVGRVFDLALIGLSGLSGPFCIFLLPIALFLAWRRCGRWVQLQAGVLATCSLIQGFGLLVLDGAGRLGRPLGASPALFARILGGQIYLGALIGQNGLSANPDPAAFVILLFAAVAGTTFAAACFIRSGLEMRLFLLFTSALLMASLLSPAMTPLPGVSMWKVLAGVPATRYWFLPTLACAWSVLWAARSRTQTLQAASVVLLCTMCFGVVRDWQHSALEDLHFAEYAKGFCAAPAGTAVIIPVNPDGWTMRLVKHAFR